MFKLIKVVTDAGKRVGFDRNNNPIDNAQLVLAEIVDLQVDGCRDVDIAVDEDVVTISGQGIAQAAKEKILVAAGNIHGVSAIEDRIETSGDADAGTFHTVRAGDTLPGIAEAHYGSSAVYPRLFKANRPMLTDPDQIYPGQLLRLPALDEDEIRKLQLGSHRATSKV